MRETTISMPWQVFFERAAIISAQARPEDFTNKGDDMAWVHGPCQIDKKDFTHDDTTEASIALQGSDGSVGTKRQTRQSKGTEISKAAGGEKMGRLKRLKVRCRCECCFSNLSGVLHKGVGGHEHHIRSKVLQRKFCVWRLEALQCKKHHSGGTKEPRYDTILKRCHGKNSRTRKEEKQECLKAIA